MSAILRRSIRIYAIRISLSSVSNLHKILATSHPYFSYTIKATKPAAAITATTLKPLVLAAEDLVEAELEELEPVLVPDEEDPDVPEAELELLEPEGFAVVGVPPLLLLATALYGYTLV